MMSRLIIYAQESGYGRCVAYHCYLAGSAHIYGSGETPAEAVGSMMLKCPLIFGLEVQSLAGVPLPLETHHDHQWPTIGTPVTTPQSQPPAPSQETQS